MDCRIFIGISSSEFQRFEACKSLRYVSTIILINFTHVGHALMEFLGDSLWLVSAALMLISDFLKSVMLAIAISSPSYGKFQI